MPTQPAYACTPTITPTPRPTTTPLASATPGPTPTHTPMPTPAPFSTTVAGLNQVTEVIVEGQIVEIQEYQGTALLVITKYYKGDVPSVLRFTFPVVPCPGYGPPFQVKDTGVFFLSGDNPNHPMWMRTYYPTSAVLDVELKRADGIYLRRVYALGIPFALGFTVLNVWYWCRLMWRRLIHLQ